MSKVLFIDTETTGLQRTGRAQPRVVSIAWAIWDTACDDFDEKAFVIRPSGFKIPSAAARIHGITTEFARLHGIDLRDALRELVDDMTEYAPSVVVAHNADYDLPIIESEYRRLSEDSPLSDLPFICTMKSTIGLCGLKRWSGKPKYPTLAELHYHLYQKRPNRSHDSAEDVRTLLRCFVALQRAGHYPSLRAKYTSEAQKSLSWRSLVLWLAVLSVHVLIVIWVLKRWHLR